MHEEKIPLRGIKKKPRLAKRVRRLLRAPVRLTAPIHRRITRRYRSWTDRHMIIWRQRLSEYEPRLGIYSYGGCDTMLVKILDGYLQPHIQGICGIYYESGNISQARSDLILQAMDFSPAQIADAQIILKEYNIADNYFQNQFPGSSFTISTPARDFQFNKDIVLFTLAGDSQRILYRHRASGLLVDPGNMARPENQAQLLQNIDQVHKFRAEFESVGALTVEQSMANWTRLVNHLKDNYGSTVFIMNIPLMVPAPTPAHLQTRAEPFVMIRRRFNLGLYELARTVDFQIIDVDRLFKNIGVQKGQIDFIHQTKSMRQTVAREFIAQIRTLGLFERKA